MSDLKGFASKDLKRRPFRTILVILSLTTVIASTTFIFLFGNVLLDISSITFSTSMSSSLGTFFSTFVWSILLLVFILGAVIVSTTVSLEMVTRRRDIGLMKAMGTLLDTIFDYFMAQSVIVLLSSVVVGIAVGTVLYLLGMIWLGASIPGLVYSNEFPIIQIGLIAAVYIIAGYFSSQKPIYDTVQESPSVALNPEVASRVRRVGLLDNLGLPFRMATKNVGRRVKGTRRTVLSLFLSFTIASMLWIGGGIVETTSESYVIRSMGNNVVAVGNPALLEQYYSAYSLYGNPLNDSFDYRSSSDIIPAQLVTDIESLLGVTDTEQRFLVYSDVEEGAGIVYNPVVEDYERIGQDRTGEALLVGVDWGETIADWYFEGMAVNESQQVWLGGTLAQEMFEDPLVQSLQFQEESLAIRALAFDILNGGRMALLDRATLQDFWGVSGANLLLVQLDSYDEVLISQIEDLASASGFGIFRQQEVLTENLQAIGAVWGLLNPLAIMALLSAFLGLMNYLLVSVFSRLRDYVIMRSVGAKPSFIATVMVAEGLNVGLQGGLPALAVSVILSIYVLIPEAAVPSTAYLPLTIVSVFVAMVVVIILAAIPVYVFFNTKDDLRVSEFAS
ncbi:MAG: FtsX-like permease family protein [Candidatus Thorarchaeota archaeon]